jgi:molybdate transport system substrate-binding protein
VCEDARPVVHAASSTRAVVEDALGDDVIVNAGATPALVRQVVAGADGVLLVSLDPRWTQDLQDRGLAEEVWVVARNRLVLAAPPGSPPPTLDTLRTASCVAIGSPDAVPAGRYAEQALTRLGLWRPLIEQLRFGDDAAATTAMIASGACPVGVLYATDAVPPAVVPGDPLPAEVQPDIPVELVLLDAGGRPFVDRLRDPTVWTRHGFLAP